MKSNPVYQKFWVGVAPVTQWMLAYLPSTTGSEGFRNKSFAVMCSKGFSELGETKKYLNSSSSWCFNGEYIIICMVKIFQKILWVFSWPGWWGGTRARRSGTSDRD